MKEKTHAVKETETQTTTIHESKHFPFQIVEVTTINDKTQKENKIFMIGAMGEIMCKTKFTKIENAEKYIASRPWELITNLMCITIKNAIEYEKSQSNS